MVWHDFVLTKSVKILHRGPSFEYQIVDTKPHFSYKKWRLGFLWRRIEITG